MKLCVRSIGVPSARIQNDLKNIISGVRSLVCELTNNCKPSQSIQRLAYLTRVQEDQGINKSFENTQTLNVLAVNLSTRTCNFLMDRVLPNILITGTPGCGKTTLATELARVSGLSYVSVNDIAKEGGLYDGFDEVNECYVLDEDRVIDEIEPKIQEGGQILDYHSCDFFPERWFDAIFVLRTDNQILYPRLASRGYNLKKIQDLIHCEIVQVVLDEARDSYDAEIVHELKSDTPENLTQNIERIAAWIQLWKKNHSK
ncbi:TAF9 RNA polymerase II TATA box binding protein [Echinococcus multilocularis]|uniref:Adenylate kinase isoenzyme 6 homolog n=1 Tax=Echinococcus multilocularis TaxID=6211 RepID=A0A068Y8V6_ECHMU|nr:TAF9 RNA polymerase II TATA box binding protein [Echinococcus multilocularis]